MNRFRFVPNVPAIVALKGPSVEGAYDVQSETVAYQLTDGRELVVSTDVATRINMLDLQPGESFGICKRWNGNRTELAHIDVWLTPKSEQERAQAENEAEPAPQAPPASPPVYQDSNDARPAKGRPRKVRVIRPEPPQPALFDRRGTGTYGPAPQTAPQALFEPRQPIPWNVAFREVLAFVTQELKAAGEQWTDQARQDAVSTVLIAAAKSGHIGLWERER